jgi:hypothetical protein
MTLAVIINLTAMFTLLTIVTATMRLPYRLPLRRRARPDLEIG